MEVLEGIYTRRSVRRYTGEPVLKQILHEIIKAGTWAPSGLNNQPWRFVTVTGEELREKIAGLTKYSKIVLGAPALIAVFLDEEAMYHEAKDSMAVGACIQNMLLAAHSMDLGAVWLGEILKNAGAVREALGLHEGLRLMAVVALGHPLERNQTSSRKDVSEVLLKEL